jgi:hypothetical protein
LPFHYTILSCHFSFDISLFADTTPLYISLLPLFRLRHTLHFLHAIADASHADSADYADCFSDFISATITPFTLIPYFD